MKTKLLAAWANGGFWDKAYVVFSIIVILMMIVFLKEYILNSATKRLDFIANAQKNGTYIPCKLTCLTKEGKWNDPYYKAEYMYIINDQRYFITYRMNAKLIMDTAKDEFDADMLVTQINKHMILFYDEKKPKKAMCKAEAFVSKNAMFQTYTPKHNIYRDVEKDWDSAIDLVSYE